MMDKRGMNGVVVDSGTVPVAGPAAGQGDGDSVVGSGGDWDSVVGPLPADDQWNRLVGPLDRVDEPEKDDQGRPVKVPWYAPHSPQKAHAGTYVMGLLEIAWSVGDLFVFGIGSDMSPMSVVVGMRVADVVFLVQGILVLGLAVFRTGGLLRAVRWSYGLTSVLCLAILVAVCLINRTYRYLPVFVKFIAMVFICCGVTKLATDDLELKS